MSGPSLDLMFSLVAGCPPRDEAPGAMREDKRATGLDSRSRGTLDDGTPSPSYVTPAGGPLVPPSVSSRPAGVDRLVAACPHARDEDPRGASRAGARTVDLGLRRPLVPSGQLSGGPS